MSRFGAFIVRPAAGMPPKQGVSRSSSGKMSRSAVPFCYSFGTVPVTEYSSGQSGLNCPRKLVASPEAIVDDFAVCTRSCSFCFEGSSAVAACRKCYAGKRDGRIRQGQRPSYVFRMLALSFVFWAFGLPAVGLRGLEGEKINQPHFTLS